MRVSGFHSYIGFMNKRTSGGVKVKNRFAPVRDQYIHTEIPSIGLYGKPRFNRTKCTNSSLDFINFRTIDFFKQHGETVNSVIVGGREYLKKSLPKVDSSRCDAIKAENNKVVFDNMHYYKYQDKNGKEHVLSCAYDKLGQPYSDLVSGRQNDSTYQIGKFWNLLSKDGTYLRSYYSDDDIKRMLSDAGITKGFYTVQVGKNRREYYLSDGNAGPAVRKFDYDATYDMLTKRGSALLNDYAVGEVFKIGDKEYALNEQRKLDIPYGEDIFNMKYPKRDMSFLKNE